MVAAAASASAAAATAAAAAAPAAKYAAGVWDFSPSIPSNYTHLLIYTTTLID